MHAYLVLHVDEDASHLYQQRYYDDGHHEAWQMHCRHQVHQAVVADEVYDVRHHAPMLVSQFLEVVATQPAVHTYPKCRNGDGADVHHAQHQQLEAPWQEAEVGAGEQDDEAYRGIVHRTEDAG